jgi:lipoprotein NlpI
LNGEVFYDSPHGAAPDKADALFAAAAGKVFEATEPYLSTAVLADTHPDRAIEIATQSIERSSASNVICRESIAEQILADRCSLGEPREAARWHNLIGSILDDRSALRQAKEHYEKAIADDPRLVIAHSNLAGLLRELGEVDSAIAHYRQAIELDPHLAAARFNLAMMLRSQEREQESKLALKAYREAIADHPSSVSAHFSFGNALFDAGQFEPDPLDQERKEVEAIDHLRRAVDLDKENLIAQNRLGRALYRLAETLPEDQEERKRTLRKEAIDRLGKAVKSGQDLGDALFEADEAHYDLGEGYYDLGVALRRQYGEADAAANDAFSEAERLHRLTIRGDPNSPRAYRELGRLLLNRDDRNGAIAAFNLALNFEPDYTEGHRALGLALFFAGRFAEAASKLRVVSDRRRDDPYWMLWLYLAERKSGNSNAGSHLEQRAKRISSEVWPYAVVELFLGRKNPDETQKMPRKQADYVCEMHFYVGEWLLLQGGERKKEALGHLTEARDKCRHEFIEYRGAAAELDLVRE